MTRLPGANSHNMLQKILPTLTSNISPGDTVIVGASGGPDSTALMHLLMEFSKQVPCRIVVAHVNHGIRGAAADCDEKFVRALAKKHELTFRARRVNLKGKSGAEEKGRNVRREFFETLRDEFSARWILTAHTQDDHIESILMHFVRGCGPRGLGGIRRTNGHYFRPLLEVPKKEILALLKRNHVRYRSDATNADMKLNRNFLRKKIIPLLRRLNPSLPKTLARNALLFSELDAFVRKQARDFLDHHARGTHAFQVEPYKKLPECIKHEVLQELHRRRGKSSYALPSSQIDAVERMISRGIGVKTVQCSDGVRFDMRRGIVKYRSLEFGRS